MVISLSRDSVRMICRICKGDGVCVECDGTGVCSGLLPPCDECEGNGKCVHCRGTGLDDIEPEFLRRDGPNDKDRRRDRYNRRHR